MEALERRLFPIAVIVFIVISLQYTPARAHRNSTKMSYVCPPSFVRLGHSCYFFSDQKATWQKALFSCKDRESNLSVPARWEDRNLRNYLNKPGIEQASRWIGGIYDYTSKAWKWGGELRRMHYQSFSKMQKLSPEQLQWHCIAMVPELKYRWAPASCHEPRQYICQTKLRKVPKSKVKDLRRRWQRMGEPNVVSAPSVSREVNDPKTNDVTINPMLSPKSYDLRPNPRQHPNAVRARMHRPRPNELRKRSRPHRRLTKPFPGYKWDRRDPERSYNYNAELLKSGKTGLTPQQVKSNLARLQHLKNKQLERQRAMREKGEWLLNDQPPAFMAKTHARTYTVDNNISALHPKTIVEEFDMLAPPPPPVPVARLTRGAFRGYPPPRRF